MEASNEGREYLVGHLVQSLKDKLDPNSVSPPNGSFSGPQANRFVLIGGPGQGKSTLSQYLAQLHRVALLAPRRARVSPDNRPILDELINQCRADGTALPSARRFPVRIDLPRFSDALDKAVKAGGQETSLIEYIAGQIRATAHMDLELEDLRAWLREYPWLIILDGLDEVPPSGNRGPVINSIREFWDEVVGCESDLAMLVTTRRQGFNDDLSPTYYNHIELVHLTTEQALTYAKRLLEYRIPNDEERAATLSRLHAASKEMATARLMVSPLQVTIMAALVQAKGDLPQDRWGLFDGYYSVVRNREQGKPEPVSRLLRTYGKDIEAVHHFAGLVLHIESERKGGADATMPVEHLREMVVQRLLSEEHSEAESRSVAEQIVGEAMTRLILLTSNNGQDIGFEIRSLQEFMASAALMGGSDSEKQKRLAYISDKSHWRHVFLFAAGRCFSEVSSEHLRASVYEICDDLDSVGEDEVHRTIRTGAKLALDLLEDAAAAGQPRPFRHLASRALRLLDVEDAGYAGRLAKVYHAYAAEQYKEAIESRLADRSRAEAWRLLFELNVRRIEWAGKRVRDYLSEASKQELYRVLIMGIRADSKSKENAEIISDGIKWVGFREAMDLASVFKDLPNESRLMKALLALQDSEDQDARVEVSVMPERGRSVLRLRMLGLFGNIRSVYREIAELRPDWNVFRIVGELASRPSQEALSAALLKLADLVESDDDSDSEIRFQFGYLPWVLGVFVSGEPKSTAFRTGAEQVARGQFGGLADWEKAERRWKANGISEADVLASANSHGIPPNIGECGSPPFRSYSVSICPEAGQIGDYLIALARKIPDGGYKHDVLHAAVFCISACRESGKYEIVPLLKSLIEVGRHAWASCLPSMSVEFWEEESVVELANRIGLNEKWFREKRLSEIHATILRSVHTHPDKNGLLVLLAMSGPGVEDERGAVEKVGYLADVDAPANVVLAHAILCARNGLFDMVNAEKVAAADLPYRVKARWLEALASSIAERASEEAAKRLALKLIGAGAHHRMLYRGLSKLADLQRTEFHVEDRWDSLALPNAYFPFTAPTS